MSQLTFDINFISSLNIDFFMKSWDGLNFYRFVQTFSVLVVNQAKLLMTQY